MINFSIMVKKDISTEDMALTQEDTRCQLCESVLILLSKIVDYQFQKAIEAFFYQLRIKKNSKVNYTTINMQA